MSSRREAEAPEYPVPASAATPDSEPARIVPGDLFGGETERRIAARRAADRQAGARTWGKAWRLSPRLLVLEILAFLVFAVLAGGGFLAWRLSQGPISLEFFRTGIERSLTEARGGEPTKIESLVLEWSRDRARVEIAAKGVTALDRNNKVVSRADKAVIMFDAASLLQGKLKTRRLRLENGRASVFRAKGGVWTLANVEVLREPEHKDKPFDPFNDIKWATLAQPIRALVAAGSFERVDIVNFSFDVVDEESGKTWAANPVNGVWRAGKDGIGLDLDIGLAGNAKPNRIQLSLGSDSAVTHANAKLALDGVDLETLAGMFGVPQDAFTARKPASASFSISATEAAGLEHARLQIAGAAGKAVIGGVDIDVADLAFDAAFDPATKRIDMPMLKIVSDRVTGDFTGSIDVSRYFNGHIGQGSPFHIAGKNMTLAVTPFFETPWPFTEANITGEIASDSPRVIVRQISAATGAAVVQGAGEVWLGQEGEQAGLIGVKFDGKATGQVTPQQVLAFWPQEVGKDARQWAREHVLAGTATNVTAHIDWPPGAHSKGYLANEVIKVDFDIGNATVSYLHDFPPVTAAFGKGHLEGNRISFDVASGKVGTWKVDEGKIVLPAFHPAGSVMQITGSGTGELRDLMRVLDASDLKTAQKYDLNIEGMSGGGFMNFDLRIPMLGDATPPDAITYTVHGGFRRAAAPDLAMGFGLTESDATVDLTQDGLRIAGVGRFGPAQTSFDWKETFNADKSTHSDLTARAIVTPDLLNAFGFAARNMMQGEADMQLEASGQGREFTSISADVDLAKAALDIPELGWSKKYDVPAKGVFRYGGDGKGGVLSGDINADGLELSGDINLNGDGELQRGSIERVYSRGSVDLRGDISKKTDGGLRIAMSGPFFDASPWMDGWLAMDRPPPPPLPPGPPGAAPVAPSPPMSLQLSADKIRVREDADLLSAKVALELFDDGPHSGVITGLAAPGKKVEVKIASDGAARLYSGKSDDAGFAARVMLKLNYLVGGAMTFDSRFTGSKGQAQVSISDVRLKDAPLLAQILSLASLRGLTDVLNGDGVLFTHVDAPLKFDAGRIDLPGLRASGPAMGLTARGWIQPEAGNLSLDGVLVPSFGINSVLGGIPIIGDLFVSRQGEGVFSPTYSVRGTLERAQISINPVSAITPGVVRRIFENPAEPPPTDQTKPASPTTAAPPDAQATPQPKAPPKPRQRLTSKAPAPQ